jgi:SAM-dependent methyltransferase
MAVDRSPAMLEFARRAVGARGEVIQADLSQGLRFIDDDPFDVVLSVATLEFLDDPHTLLMEFSRLLRPGGVLILTISHPISRRHQDEPGMYFVERIVETQWPKVEPPATIAYYFRPVAFYLNALCDAGLCIERVLEPSLDDVFESDFPELATRIRILQPFLSIRLRKSVSFNGA